MVIPDGKEAADVTEPYFAAKHPIAAVESAKPRPT